MRVGIRVVASRTVAVDVPAVVQVLRVVVRVERGPLALSMEDGRVAAGQNACEGTSLVQRVRLASSCNVFGRQLNVVS